MISLPLPLLIGALLIVLLIGFRRGRTAHERKLVREYKRHCRAVDHALKQSGKA